ncbi:hypothetical protein [Terrarubrum flagellatum]|uniref:hypothetical protein n=1 Tax=Terrirubrum flagellatum TaxID=2895980 RepID=UPI00314508C7
MPHAPEENASGFNAGTQQSERDIAIYVAHMTAEMAAMARTAKFDLLAYFLDMARIEARIQADQSR